MTGTLEMANSSLDGVSSLTLPKKNYRYPSYVNRIRFNFSIFSRFFSNIRTGPSMRRPKCCLNLEYFLNNCGVHFLGNRLCYTEKIKPVTDSNYFAKPSDNEEATRLWIRAILTQLRLQLHLKVRKVGKCP